jgi:hypothetical protein
MRLCFSGGLNPFTWHSDNKSDDNCEFLSQYYILSYDVIVISHYSRHAVEFKWPVQFTSYRLYVRSPTACGLTTEVNRCKPSIILRRWNCRSSWHIRRRKTCASSSQELDVCCNLSRVDHVMWDVSYMTASIISMSSRLMTGKFPCSSGICGFRWWHRLRRRRINVTSATEMHDKAQQQVSVAMTTGRPPQQPVDAASGNRTVSAGVESGPWAVPANRAGGISCAGSPALLLGTPTTSSSSNNSTTSLNSDFGVANGNQRRQMPPPYTGGPSNEHQPLVR